MPTLTLAIPEELKKEMNSMPELNWSEIAREAISEKAAKFKLFKSITSRHKTLPLEKVRELLNSAAKYDVDTTSLAKRHEKLMKK